MCLNYSLCLIVFFTYTQVVFMYEDESLSRATSESKSQIHSLTQRSRLSHITLSTFSTDSDVFLKIFHFHVFLVFSMTDRM